MTWFLLSTKLKKQEQPLAFISTIFYDCQITTTSRDSKKMSMDKQRQKLKLLVICVREVKSVLFINV